LLLLLLIPFALFWVLIEPTFVMVVNVTDGSLRNTPPLGALMVPWFRKDVTTAAPLPHCPQTYTPKALPTSDPVELITIEE